MMNLMMILITEMAESCLKALRDYLHTQVLIVLLSKYIFGVIKRALGCC